MCGRVIQASPPDELSLQIVDGLLEQDRREAGRYGNVPPRYNGAPSQELWVIRRNGETGETSLDLLRWGLLPSFLKDKPKPPPINARAETAASSRLFGRAFAKRRCILPVDGFYEWQPAEDGGKRQPFAIARRDRKPFGIAGLWDNWHDPDSGEWLRSFCVLTTAANADLANLHERMPVILDPADYARWLDPDQHPTDLLKPCPAGLLEIWPVSPQMNSPRFDAPAAMQRLQDPAPLPPKPAGATRPEG